MSATGRSKRVVVALLPGGAVRAIGPVYTDRTVERLRAEVVARGWLVGDVIPVESPTEFRASTGRERQAADR